ncbi:hypothetical protein AB0J52_41730, partial [Spirillospora sp. NPDC049652]
DGGTPPAYEFEPTGAAVIAPDRVRPRTAAAYLAAVLPPDPGPGWAGLLRALRAGDPVLARALSTPLALWLVRVHADVRADPAPLLDRALLPTARDIEDHLLDGLIEAALRHPAPRRADALPRRVPDAEVRAGRRWLAFLARHLNALGTRDLEWWELRRAVSPAARALAAGLAALLVSVPLFAVCDLALRAAADPERGEILPGGWRFGIVVALAFTAVRLVPRRLVPGRRGVTDGEGAAKARDSAIVFLAAVTVMMLWPAGMRATGSFSGLPEKLVVALLLATPLGLGHLLGARRSDRPSFAHLGLRGRTRDLARDAARSTLLLYAGVAGTYSAAATGLVLVQHDATALRELRAAGPPLLLTMALTMLPMGLTLG